MTPRSRSIWREALGRSWLLDPRMTSVVLALIVGEIVALAMTGLAMRSLVDGAVNGARGELVLSAVVGALGFGLSGVGGYVRMELRADLSDRIGYQQIDPEVQRLAARLEGLEHLERPAHLDRLSVVAGRGQVLVDAGWGVVEAAALVLQILVTLVLLATVHPALLALAVFAVPGALLSRRASARVRASIMATAESARVEKHLYEVITRPGPVKEIRVNGATAYLIGRASAAWRNETIAQSRARVAAALLAGIGSAVFVTGYALVLLFVILLVARGDRSVADLVLVAALAGQLRFSFDSVLFKLTQVHAGLAVANAYRQLRDYASSDAAATGPARPVPRPLRDGITLRQVTFCYPDDQRQVLGPLDVHLPAGATVGLVGAYGSGKTTLVKLLCKFYPPTTGKIEIDGTSLQDIDTRTWRDSTTAAFQDFGRYQARMRQVVGLGDPPYADDETRVLTAIGRAGAADLPAGLPDGLDTRLGGLFEDGRDLSEGQWQQTALARACMRPAPLLVVLDEPTASLDAPSEHAIFDRHAALARELGAEHGTVTIVVSHRYSTVRMADVILVLGEGRIVELGSHDELMNAGGRYAEMYRLQEHGYRAAGGGGAASLPVDAQATVHHQVLARDPSGRRGT